jgi:hypothetical protein
MGRLSPDVGKHLRGIADDYKKMHHKHIMCMMRRRQTLKDYDFQGCTFRWLCHQKILK